MKLVTLAIFSLFSSLTFARTEKVCTVTDSAGVKQYLFARINRADLFDPVSLVLTHVKISANMKGDECSWVENDTYSSTFESYSNPCIKVEINKRKKVVSIQDLNEGTIQIYSDLYCHEGE